MPRGITLEQAEAVVAGCTAEAAGIGQPMNIAVVDDGANLVAFASMDGTIVGGVGVSAGTVEEDHQVAEAGRRAFTG